jgi:LysM repeat protein
MGKFSNMVVAVALAAPIPLSRPTVTVEAGDSLTLIAARYDLSVADLAGANDLAVDGRLSPGEVLRVPSTAGPSLRPGSTYVVQAGDTLSSVAHRSGLTVAAIAAANNIADPNRIWVGNVLRLPAGGSASPAPAASSSPAAGPGTSGPSTRYLVVGARKHTVTKGETLASLGSQVGRKASTLATANRLSRTASLSPGQSVWVPGSFVCPAASPTFSDDFGVPRPGGRFHEGNDLLDPMGTPVRAPVGGSVVRYPNPLGGNAFQLRGNDGNRYYGAHLSAYGASGDAVGGPTHLHFEIHPDGGSAVDPFSTLVLACRG